MTTLWDTTGTAVVKALAAERRSGGAVMSGLALTLVVVVDEKDVGGDGVVWHGRLPAGRDAGIRVPAGGSLRRFASRRGRPGRLTDLSHTRAGSPPTRGTAVFARDRKKGRQAGP